MKTKLILYITILVGLYSCNKDQDMYKQPNYESVNSSVLCYQSLYDIVRICDGVASQPAFTGTVQPITFTKDSLSGYINAHINLNDTLTRHSDGRKRSGKMELNFKKDYFVTNTLFKVSLVNYNVNGYVFNGDLTYTILSSSLSNKYFKIIANDLKVTSPSNTYSINSILTINSTGFYSSYVKGFVNGTGSLFNYTSNTIDSLYITTRFYYKSKFDLNAKDFDAVINYGDGQNDSLATATSNDFRFIINLKSF